MFDFFSSVGFNTRFVLLLLRSHFLKKITEKIYIQRMETVTMDDEALTADSHDSHDSDSDSDANSNSNSDHSSLLNPLVPFQENSQELAMAQTEEEELRRLANERMVGQVDPIVVKALELAKKVEEEKLNDHGKVSERMESRETATDVMATSNFMN